MRKLLVAMAIVLGLNLVGAIVNLSLPVAYAQDNPEPEKPEKPGD